MESSSLKTKRFRHFTVAPKFHVDGGLFGKTFAKTEKGDTIQLFSSDLIRNIGVRRDPEETGRLPAAEYRRICSTKSMEATEAARESSVKTKEETLKAAKEMKEKIQKIDSTHLKRTPTKIEREAKTQAQFVMERTKALKMEQEEEIKKLNRVIANVKYQAAHDYQVQEKKQIQAELSEENLRLDLMMETNRLKSLDAEAQIQELRKKETIKYKQQIVQDIQQRLQMKQIRDMDLEHDRQHMQKIQKELKLEKLEASERKSKEQQRLQMEMLQYNMEKELAEERKTKEEAATESRIQAFKQQRSEHEAKVQAEQRRVRLEKEMATAGVGLLQQRANAASEMRHERFMKNLQQNTDGEWRRQQRELAEKKLQANRTLQAAHMEQIHSKQRLQSAEARQQKAEFDQLLKTEQDAIVKQKQVEEKRRKSALRTAEILQHQMKDRKAVAMGRCRESMESNKELALAEQQRLVDLRECRQMKLEQLRASGVPGRYQREAELKTSNVTEPVKPFCRFPPKPSNVGLPPIHMSYSRVSGNQ